MTNYNQIETITRYLDSLESRISNLETSGRLLAAGIGAGGINVYDSGSITVKDQGSVNIYDGGSLEIYGTSSDLSTITVGSGGKVISDGPVQFSKSSSFGGDVSITGNLTVTGNLTIKKGLIKSNALKNQMSGTRASNTSTNFSIGTSFTDRVSATISSPSWANTAVVYVAGAIQHRTEVTSGDALLWADARAGVNSSYSQDHVSTPLGSGDLTYGTTVGYSRVVSNPGTITGAVQARSTKKTIPADSYNRATISVYVIFYR